MKRRSYTPVAEKKEAPSGTTDGGTRLEKRGHLGKRKKAAENSKEKTSCSKVLQKNKRRENNN